MWWALSSFVVKSTVEVNLTLVRWSVVYECYVYPSVFVCCKVVIEVCGTVGVRSPVSLMQESVVSDSVVDTLASLTEEELVSTEVRWLDPCSECVAAFTLNDRSDVNARNANESVLKISCSRRTWSCRCSA